ncbi:nuclear transport factor 2 family protein [uncultured Sphingomonas sp.]|uniref:nuclear transport factor 2 family protein n=1 Tax=uncultured Sphingomonas sp. TaxID=158754 RepID=UPI00261313A1|nr:nuclear transport factor 2 family protein [uncultured Sphingomonas sp.]
MMEQQPVGADDSADARLACLNLMHAYNNLADTGQHVLIADLFAEDAILNANGEEMAGIEAIRAGMRRRTAANLRTVHTCASVQFGRGGAGELTALSTLSVVILTDQPQTLAPTIIARVNDAFAPLPSGEWRFRRRTLETLSQPQPARPSGAR